MTSSTGSTASAIRCSSHRLTISAPLAGTKPRALFAGVVEASEALTRLQAAQERVAAAHRAGAGRARKFVPHVTLARLRGNGAEDVARFMAGRRASSL